MKKIRGIDKLKTRYLVAIKEAGEEEAVIYEFDNAADRQDFIQKAKELAQGCIYYATSEETYFEQ